MNFYLLSTTLLASLVAIMSGNELFAEKKTFLWLFSRYATAIHASKATIH